MRDNWFWLALLSVFLFFLLCLAIVHKGSEAPLSATERAQHNTDFATVYNACMDKAPKTEDSYSYKQVMNACEALAQGNVK